MDTNDIVINDDIIYNILDMIRNPVVIKRCMVINKQWHTIIKSRVNKYLKTLKMFAYLYHNDNDLRNKFNIKFLNLIKKWNFNETLNKSIVNTLSGNDSNMIKNTIIYIPGKCNNIILTEISEKTIDLVNLFSDYIYNTNLTKIVSYLLFTTNIKFYNSAYILEIYDIYYYMRRINNLTIDVEKLTYNINNLLYIMIANNPEYSIQWTIEK